MGANLMDAARGVAAAFVEHAQDDPVGFEGHHLLLLYVCLLGIGIIDLSVSAVWRAAGALYNFTPGKSRYSNSPCLRPTMLLEVEDTSDTFLHAAIATVVARIMIATRSRACRLISN